MGPLTCLSYIIDIVHWTPWAFQLCTLESNCLLHHDLPLRNCVAWPHYLRSFASVVLLLKMECLLGGENELVYMKGWLQFLAHSKHLMSGCYYYYHPKKNNSYTPALHIREFKNSYQTPRVPRKRASLNFTNNTVLLGACNVNSSPLVSMGGHLVPARHWGRQSPIYFLNFMR